MPLASGSHADVRGYAIKDGELAATLADGKTVGLADPKQLRGYRGSPDAPTAILLVNNGLHIELRHRSRASGRARRCRRRRRRRSRSGADHDHGSGRLRSPRSIRSTRWPPIATGSGSATATLAESFQKDGKPLTRRLAADRSYTAPDGGALALPGRSLMLIRNVGHLMMDEGVLDRDGQPAPEGVLDAAITSLIALHDLKDGAAIAQQPRRLDLYRQAEDARAGRGRIRQRSVRARSRTCSACRATPSSSA